MEDHAALRAIGRPDTGEGYREMLTRMAQESGIETPTAEDLIRLDRQRRGKTLSNEEWVSAHARTRGSRACPDARIARMPGRADRAHARTRGSRACPDARIARMPGRADRAHARTRGSRACPDARIARMKDGTTHLADKPEHAIDLDTGAVVAAEGHAADQGDTPTITGTLDAAHRNLTRVGAPPCSDDPAECVADKGYHARAVLTDLDGGPWQTRIAEPQRRGISRWHGDADARRAVYNNRTRLRSEVGKQAMRQRAELVERSFAHILDRGGLRRTWLRGRENVHKRYLLHVA